MDISRWDGGGGGGVLGLSLILSKANGSQEISMCFLVCPLIAFSTQDRSDIIQHERFLLLAIWSHQFC